MRNYTLFMIDKYGKEKVQEMLQEEKKIHKIYTPEIEEMIGIYKEKVEEQKKSKISCNSK